MPRTQSVIAFPARKRTSRSAAKKVAESVKQKEDLPAFSPAKRLALIGEESSPAKRTKVGGENETTSTPVKPTVFGDQPRIPLSPRHNISNILNPPQNYSGLHSPHRFSSVLPDNPRSPGYELRRAMVSDNPRSPGYELRRAMASDSAVKPGALAGSTGKPATPHARHAFVSPTTDQAKSSLKKENASPQKAVCRNLSSCFGDGSSKSGVASPLKLCRDKGVAYQKTKEVLHTALPDTLVGREQEITSVAAFLDGHLAAQRPGSLYVSGGPGTGKTAVLSKAIETLKAEKSCRVVYINCMRLRNAQAIYNGILSALKGVELQLPAKQAPVHIEKYLAASKSMVVLVLDEIDSLDTRSQDVLYTMFEWPTLPGSTLVLIGIANSLDLTDRILPRLQARPRCKPQLLHFPPYTREQIVSVLNDRLLTIDGGSVLEPAAIQFCARKVSAMAGDVRMAIDICRRAVELVETDVRKQLVLGSAGGCSSPSKRAKRAGVAQVMKIVNEVYGSRVEVNAGQPLTIPLQQTLCICTLLLMLRDGKAKEAPLGKFHESYSLVCQRQSVAKIDQSEFMSLCSLVEARGIFALKKAKDTRNIKISLKMDEKELMAAMQDKTLMSAILKAGIQ